MPDCPEDWLNIMKWKNTLVTAKERSILSQVFSPDTLAHQTSKLVLVLGNLIYKDGAIPLLNKDIETNIICSWCVIPQLSIQELSCQSSLYQLQSLLQPHIPNSFPLTFSVPNSNFHLTTVLLYSSNKVKKYIIFFKAFHLKVTVKCAFHYNYIWILSDGTLNSYL